METRFPQDVITEFDDLKVLNECTSEEINTCLISLDQIRGFIKNDFISFMNNIEKCKYIIVVSPDDADKTKRLMQTGGKSFVLMDDTIEIIFDCIANTIKYGWYISPRIVALLNIGNETIIQAQYKFTPKHRAILPELLKGKSDKIIAQTLNISYHTTKTHRKRLYKILNINSQGELFALFY